MYKRASRAVAAMLVVLPACSIWPPAPGTPRQVAPATAARVPGAGSPDRIMRPRVEPSVAPSLLLREPGCPALSEMPGDRATVHWIEYLKFMSPAD
jgi:hypothetical protein